MEKKKFNREQQNVLRKQNKKGCQKCGEIKSYTDDYFSNIVNGKSYPKSICKGCHNQRRIEKYEKNPEIKKRDLAKVKERYEYICKNQPEVMSKRRLNSLEQCNPKNSKIGKALWHLKKTKRFVNRFGEDISVYKMYGIPYDVDHLIPKNWFKDNCKIKIINDLDNLQVIDLSYNRSKKDRWSDPVPSDYLDKIRPYIKKKFEGLLKSL